MGEENIKETMSENVNSYTDIAQFYNYLMRSIDYKGWARYIYSIYQDYEINSSRILELGSGTCALSKYLIKKFPEIIVSDLSHDMLSSVDFKLERKVVCDMTAMPFRERFDFIFSTFDSINYLTEEEILKKLFVEISHVLSETGIFTFDVSLEANSIRYEKSLNRKGKFQGIKYVQDSKYDRGERIHTNTFRIIFPDGRNVEEVHKQKIYELDQYFDYADQAGLTVMDCFEAFTLKDINKKSERAQFVIKRKE